MPELLYCGGESSRIYSGRWQVLVWFHQRDGEYVWDETDAGDYDAALATVRSFGDGSAWHDLYHVERALIVPAPAV